MITATTLGFSKSSSAKDDGTRDHRNVAGRVLPGSTGANREEEDGRNQKADAEYVIREALVKADLIECIIVLPTKLFYGNSVPGCLVVLNKRKAPDRKGKILLIWASRDDESNNPQNIIGRADCMRILVPWRAFGDLKTCCDLVPKHEANLIEDLARERDAALADIDDAYRPFFDALGVFRQGLTEREVFAEREPPSDKEERLKFREEKKKNTERLKIVKREIKALGKLDAEAEEKRVAVRKQAEREIASGKSAAADLFRICSDPDEAGRYFAIAEYDEVQKNEFNLHVPRYVDTFEPEEQVEVGDALAALTRAECAQRETMDRLRDLLRLNGAR